MPHRRALYPRAPLRACASLCASLLLAAPAPAPPYSSLSAPVLEGYLGMGLLDEWRVRVAKMKADERNTPAEHGKHIAFLG